MKQFYMLYYTESWKKNYINDYEIVLLKLNLSSISLRVVRNK